MLIINKHFNFATKHCLATIHERDQPTNDVTTRSIA